MPDDTQQAVATAMRPDLSRVVASLPRFVGFVAVIATLSMIVLEFASAFVLSNGPFGYAAWVEDDFFYYAVIAQNIVETGRSTFDGVTLTNGYHPLWMLVCIGAAALFGIHSTAFFVAIYLIQAALVLAGVAVMAALTARVARAGLMSTGGRLLTCASYGLVFTLIGMRGMEIALLAPLMPMVLLALWTACERPSLRSAFVASGLLCVTVLSRLDTAIVFAPVSLGVAVYVLRRQGLAKGLALAPAGLAFVPFAAYLAFNHRVFASAFPLSGAAKRMMVEGAPFGFSALSAQSFLEAHNLNYVLAPQAIAVASVFGLIVVLASRTLRGSLAGAGFVLVGVGVAGFYAQASLTSDWRLWPWYYFALALFGSLSIGLIFDAAVQHKDGPARHWASLAICALLTLAVLRANLWVLGAPASQSNVLFLRALPILEFAKTHPGRYAMGDGAGAVGFVLPDPLVQLEGLVSDGAMLDDIRRGGTVEASLQRQGVDYYITSELKLKPGCNIFEEPAQGGPRVARLTETICEAPVMTDKTGWIATQIWDVRDGLD